MAVTRRILTMDKQEVLLRWAGARIGIDSWRSDSYALGLLEPDGRVIAVGVLNMFHDQGAWVHLAADRSRNWLCAPELLPQVFAWPFIELGLERLTARIAMGNIESQIAALRLGFHVEGAEPRGFNGQDVAIFGMLRGECPWLKINQEEI